MLQAPSAFISMYNGDGGPSRASVGKQLHWELAQNQGWHIKGASQLSHNLG